MLSADASPAFGFGFCVAPASPELVRATAAASSDPVCVVRLTLDAADDAEKPRLGSTLRVPLTMGDFKPIFSVSAATSAHSGVMELQAVELVLLRHTRVARRHSRRGVVLVDAMAIGGALQQVRSSAGTTRHGVWAIGLQS